MKRRTSDCGAPPLDLVETFGPMAGMHVALARAGAGMPCGIVARLPRRSAREVEAAIDAAATRFPVLRSRLAWRAGRPVLAEHHGCNATDVAAPAISLDFLPGLDGLLWRYALREDGGDVWLSAVWSHAAADGRSMLHFLDTVVAALENRPAPARTPERGRTEASVALARWLVGFLAERRLKYVKAQGPSGVPDVSWTTLPPDPAGAALGCAAAQGTGFGAWLAAAASIALCELQQGERAGRISLDLLASRSDGAAFGGFGFAAGSLLIPVELEPGTTLATVARRIGARQRTMLAGGWDQNLERFLGRHPLRHRLFATLEARGIGSPSISVSWKGVYPELGARGAVRDIACFATSNIAHVSAHVDANGLSLSVASRLAGGFRQDLLARIAALLGARVGRVHSLIEHAGSACPRPAVQGIAAKTAQPAGQATLVGTA